MSKSKLFSVALLALMLTTAGYSAGTATTPAKTTTTAAKTVNAENIELTEAYVKEVGKMSYFWGWPMANMYNRYIF